MRIVQGEVYEYKCSLPGRTVVKSYYVDVCTTGTEHVVQHLS